MKIMKRIKIIIIIIIFNYVVSRNFLGLVMATGSSLVEFQPEISQLVIKKWYFYNFILLKILFSNIEKKKLQTNLLAAGLSPCGPIHFTITFLLFP
jgi:hypothetical protein